MRFDLWSKEAVIPIAWETNPSVDQSVCGPSESRDKLLSQRKPARGVPVSRLDNKI